MRLGDLDALRDYFAAREDCPFKGEDVVQKLDAAPTVCCEECVCGPMCLATDHGIGGCDRFERRQP